MCFITGQKEAINLATVWFSLLLGHWIAFTGFKWDGSVPQTAIGWRGLGHSRVAWWVMKHIKRPWLCARETFTELSTCDLRQVSTTLNLTAWWCLPVCCHLWPSEVESVIPLADSMSGLGKNDSSHGGSTVQSTKCFFIAACDSHTSPEMDIGFGNLPADSSGVHSEILHYP